MLAVASIATTVSGMLGMIGGDAVARFDPGAAQRASESGHLAVQLAVGEPAACALLVPEHDGIRGGLFLPVDAAPARSRFCAKFSRASGNHRAPGILWPSTSTRLPRTDAMTLPKSQTESQNWSGLSIDQRYRDG